MRIGISTIPPLRVPAFLKGQLIIFDLANLQGRWSIVSFLPTFEFCDAISLNQYHRKTKKEGTLLLGMLPFSDPFLDPRLPKAKILRMPILADPLQRLRRIFGLNEKASANRCESFIIDPERVIKYHLIHQLNWRGLPFLTEILKHCQDQYSPSNKPPHRSEKIINLNTFSRVQNVTV